MQNPSVYSTFEPLGAADVAINDVLNLPFFILSSTWLGLEQDRQPKERSGKLLTMNT